MEGKEKGRKERKKRILFFSPRKVASLSPGKRKKSPRTPVFPREKGKEEREKEEERDGFRIRFLRGIQGKKDGRKERRRKEECSFSVFQGGFSLSRRRKKSSGFKGRRKERRKRKKMRCLAWRMGF